MIFVSSTSSGDVGGIPFADEDVLIYATNTGDWGIYFDGSDVVTTTLDVDGFSRLDDGSFLLSFDVEGNVDTLGLVDDSDIVRFIPSSVGPITEGTFAWYFDGSDVDLLDDREDIDAVTLLSDGRLVLSTVGHADITGMSDVRDEDLLLFTPAQPLGDDTTEGTWERYFDGSEVGLGESFHEDVKSVWIDPTNGDIYLTTTGVFTVTGLSGNGGDIFICTPGSADPTTNCTFRPYWEGPANGFASEVTDVVEIDKSTASLSALQAIEHQGEGDDPKADPLEGPDEVADPIEKQPIFLPLIIW
jgi:hypothetical protein